MFFYRIKYLILLIFMLLRASNGVPLNTFLKDFFLELNTCPKEYHSLHNTCGESAIEFMWWLEQRAMSEPDLVDPTRCLDGRYESVQEVDFVVIGAGLAGSMVGGRLSEVRDWEVMVLEAGDAAPSASNIPGMYFNYWRNPKYDYAYDLIPQNNACLNSYGICTYPRGKVMGGTAAIHGMMYMRGNPFDYDILEQDGIEGWSWKEVFPFFLKSEDNLDVDKKGANIDPQYHATGGPMQISRFAHQPAFAKELLSAYEELGYNINVDLNGASQKGFMIAQATNRNGSRLTSAKAYLYDNMEVRHNLYVQPNSKVLKILVNPTTMAAEGVIYDHKGSQRIVKVRKEVILSGGAIASPQILMLSGIGPKDHLEEVGITVIKDLPGVGQNLNNHVSTEIFFNVGADDNIQELNENTAEDFLTHRKGPMTSTGLSQVTGFLWSDFTPDDPRPDLQIFHAGYMANCSKTGSVGEVIGNGHKMFSISPTVLNAKSVGWVKLRNRYPESDPLIFGNVLGEESDIEVLLAGIRAVTRLTSTPTMIKKKVTLDTTVMPGCEKEWWNSEKYWRCYIMRKTNPENHQTGTCRMGLASDPKTVVDNKLRVIGISNLRVADASVFPRSPSANLQGPTMMVAERASKFIHDKWITAFDRYW